MDFSLRSVRRPTVLSIPTAPFSFQHSTFVLGEVCRLDPSGLSRLDRLRLRRPCLLPLLRAPCRCLCGFISRRSPFVELVVRFLSVSVDFYAAFFSRFRFTLSLIGSSCLAWHHSSYRPRSCFLTASLVMYRLYSGSLTLRSRFSAPF